MTVISHKAMTMRSLSLELIVFSRPRVSGSTSGKNLGGCATLGFPPWLIPPHSVAKHYTNSLRSCIVTMHPLRATLPHPWYSGKRGKTPSLHKFTSFTGTKQEILSPGKEQCAELSRQANRNRAPILAVGGLGAKKFLYRANQNLEKQVVKISL